MTAMSIWLFLLFATLWQTGKAFVPPRAPTPSVRSSSPPSSDKTHSSKSQHPGTSLHVTTGGNLNAAQLSRRKELLSRTGPYFQLNRFQGDVEFGSSAKLITKLDDEANPTRIAEFLSDGRGLALSIWDETLMKDLGNSMYRLQTMKLRFVTIQLAPSVDVQMWTHPDPETGQPVFSIQSVNFDPNIQVLPGIGVSASSLGLHIDVVGELRPSKDGKGVTGSISFASTGTLPPPLRILPEPPLKMASNTINDTVVSFAVENFQKGAIRKYKEFCSNQTGKTAKLQEQPLT